VTTFQKLKKLFFGFDERPEIIFAKVRALRTQIPLLYFILMTNVVTTSVVHLEKLPLWLTVFLPATGAALALGRAISWSRLDTDNISLDDARTRLKTTIRLVPLLAGFFVAWAIILAQAASPMEQGQIAVFLAITCAASMLCLMHLRSASLQLGLITIIPFTFHFMLMPGLAAKAIAVNSLLALGAMTLVVIRQHHTFFHEVLQNSELAAKNIETQKLSDENLRLATRDMLTGLPNRRSFIADFQRTLKEAKLSQSQVAIILIDLDGFKPINDLYGHAAGDNLLVKVGARLRDAVRDTCLLARLGGDEFAIAMSGFNNNSDVNDFAGHILTAINQPYRVSQVECTVSASIGIAVLGSGGFTDHELFEHADYALYQAKESRDGRPVFFEEEHQHAIRLLHEVDQHLRRGTLESELSLAYQPIVLAATRELAGYEALARWNSEKLGSISPAVFIPAAERSGMGDRVTHMLFRKLLQEMRTLPETIPVSFNLSARDLVNTSSTLRIVTEIQSSGISAKRVQFEITEASIAADFEKVERSLRMLRNMGCAISIDNFGSSQSILSYIYRLPVTSVKIDTKFIAECEKSEPARRTLQAIVRLCDDLDLTCTAVGIETEKQALLASDIGCMLLQGFHLARPKPLRDILSDHASAA
jgi:diguanylate cyclase (GGDEF)-like protein